MQQDTEWTIIVFTGVYMMFLHRDMQTDRGDVGTVLKTGEFVEIKKVQKNHSASSDPLYSAKFVSTNTDSGSL